MNTAHNQPLLTAADLQQLQSLSRRFPRRRLTAQTPWSGPHASALRGHGLEFSDLRPYQTGDDIRHIDWRATARTGKPTTKIFLEERRRALHLVVDRGPPMWFGTRGDLKAGVAARVAALHTFAALAGGDKVSGTVLDGGERHYPATHSMPGALLLLRAIAAAAPYGMTSSPRPREWLRHLSHALTRGADIVMISDFAWLDATLAGVLADVAQRHTMTALRIVDPAEQELADAGLLRLVSPLSGAITVVDTGDAQLRRDYALACAQRDDELNRCFARAGVRTITIRTDQAISDVFGASLTL